MANQKEKSIKTRSPMKWLLHHVRRRIPAILVMTAANVGIAAFSVLFALGTKDVINSAVSGTKDQLIAAVAVQLGIVAGILLCQVVFRYLKSRLLADLDRDWKQQLTHRLLRGEYQKISSFHSGELINRLNNDVAAVNAGLIHAMPAFAAMITKLIASLLVLLSLAPAFTLLLLGAGGALMLATALARRYLQNLNKAVSAANGRVSGFLQECFEKLRLVQGMNLQQEVERRGDALLEERYQVQKKRWLVTLTANTCISIMGHVAGFLALTWCAFHLFGGTMSFGELTAVTQLVSLLQAPIVNMSGAVTQYLATAAAAERLMELEDACGEPQATASTAPDYDDLQAIAARDLSFGYDRKLIFEHADFELPKGSFCVVVGPSGVGKSTIINLLLGIFDPADGKLLLRCRNREVPVSRTTRSLFAYVPQGNLLFSGTLRENLLLTKPDATEEQLQQAIYVSCMDDFLPELPRGLETVLGENAHGLSEGQAQRLSIARAVLGGAPVLLLDEVTSALDASTEQRVLQRLRKLPDKTCIAVTHRPAAIEMADWVLQVEPGSVTCRKLNSDKGEPQ